MMSETGEGDNGTESTFEFVNTTNANVVADAFGIAPTPAASVTIPAPASLPAFATLPQSVSKSNTSAQPPVAPPPSAFPPLNAATSRPQSNPFSIRATAPNAATSAPVMPPMPSYQPQPPTMPTQPPAISQPPTMGPQPPTMGPQPPTMGPQPPTMGLQSPPMPTMSGGVGFDMSSSGHDDPFIHQQKASGGSGVWGWIQGTVNQSQLLSKVAEKAKTSVDSMITTLDPQMKNYLHSDGAIELAIASDKEVEISAIREGFQFVFGQASVTGLGSPGVLKMAEQASGLQNGSKCSKSRIASLHNSGLVLPDTPICAVENFINMVDDDVFDADWLTLEDSARGITLNAITQAIQIPLQASQYLKTHTPSNYEYISEGFAVTTAQAVGQVLGVPPCDWHYHAAGVSRKELILNAAKSLAHMYKQALTNGIQNTSINIQCG